jgi:hypothetical protein
MSLLDALFLDLYPRNVWIAHRLERMKTMTAICIGFFWCASLLAQGTMQRWGANGPQDTSPFLDSNGSLIRPFANPSSRFQQVYSATDFFRVTTNTGAGLVDSIFFRLDATNGTAFSGIARNLEIRLSTTTKGPDSLSPVFSENIGSNERVVFGPVDTLISSDVPYAFTLRIDFATPFLYRPADGNLLVDFRVSGGVNGILDAWNRFGDSVGSVSGNRDDISGFASTIGLATHIEGTFVTVPEPSTYALIALGALAPFLFRKRRRM